MTEMMAPSWTTSANFSTQLRDSSARRCTKSTRILSRCATSLQELRLHQIGHAFPSLKPQVDDDPQPEQGGESKFAAMEENMNAQDRNIQALQAQLRGDTTGAKRGCNGVPVQKKAVPVCLKRKVEGGIENTQSKTAGRTSPPPWQRSTLRWQRESGGKSRSASLPLKRHARTLPFVIKYCDKASVAAEAVEESDSSPSRILIHGSCFESSQSTHVALQ